MLAMVVCAFSMLLAAGRQTERAGSAHARLAELIEQEWQYELETSPEEATAIGDNRYNDRLTDYSAAAFGQRAERTQDFVGRLQQVPEAALSAEDRLNRALLIRMLETNLDDERLKAWEMPVDQMNGPHLAYASLARDMPFGTAHDYRNYLSRLHGLPRVFREITEDMRLGLRDGLMPPRYLLEKVATEAQNIADRPIDESSFTTPLKQFPASISPEEQATLKTEIERAVSAEVLPAYSKFAVFVKTDYAPKGRTEYGVWSLPDGARRYRQAIRSQTTTDRDPAELHALGLKQVTAIEIEMKSVAKQLGFSDLKSFNAHILADRKLYGTSGEQILGLYQKYTDQMYAKLPQYFGRLPKNRLAVVPMEAFRAPDAVPADYSIGAGDGSRPGRINVNEYAPTKRLMLNAEAIAYHEGVPGHHLQFSIAQELPDLPAFRKFAQYNAYSEGWALYAETLGHELGFYQSPYSEYGRLENLMWRSIRLVVDTGVHSQHWSRQQMIDFFRQHTAMDDQNIETEVDRYIAWPGQALGYKLGEMTILKLREKARQQLGERFDIRQFHDAILGEGPLPLDVLETEVTRWMNGSGKR